MISHPSALSGAIFIKGKPLIVPNIWPKPAVFPLILSSASIRNLQLLVVLSDRPYERQSLPRFAVHFWNAVLA